MSFLIFFSEGTDHHRTEKNTEAKNFFGKRRDCLWERAQRKKDSSQNNKIKKEKQKETKKWNERKATRFIKKKMFTEEKRETEKKTKKWFIYIQELRQSIKSD